jgi:Flp pilus assembly protein TadG
MITHTTAFENKNAGRLIARSSKRRRGMGMLYVVVSMIAFVGFTSLAVDLGRVQLAKTQLQTAADAAARAGATALNGQSSVAAAAANAAAANSCDMTPVNLDQSQDVQLGYWTQATKTFVACDRSVANAVRVTARRSASRGTGVPLMFLQVLGVPTCDISAQATVMLTPSETINVPVSGQADPWLAGAPDGTTANYYSQFGDCAPKNSPVLAPLTTMEAGNTLNFQFSGSVSYYPGLNPFGCDGNANYVNNNYWAAANGNAEHGIANVTAPICAVIGVFLDDNDPSTTNAPAALDFSTAASREFTSISPQLKQPFFIGDGMKSDGTLQNFVVPPGATRLFIGVMDFQQWSDNSGAMTTTVVKPPHVNLVQ